MARLIDADRALETVCEQGTAHPNAYYLTNYAMAILKEAPHVDAEEVIRCKDCIGQSTWFKDAETGCEICGMSGMYPKVEFDFCSYGDRRKP